MNGYARPGMLRIDQGIEQLLECAARDIIGEKERYKQNSNRILFHGKVGRFVDL